MTLTNEINKAYENAKETGKMTVSTFKIPKNKTLLKCNFCGKVFYRVIKANTYEIQCPKCKEYDIELD